MPPTKQERPLHVIADEIIRDWPKANDPNHQAGAYLLPMQQLNRITDRYGMDEADTIVRYFLSNATSWRGDVARRVKAELKAML